MSSPTGASAARSSLDAEALAGFIDPLFARFARPGAPGASVAVFHCGRSLFTRAYGLASLHPAVPATPHTQYRLASLSKQFTATAVLLLIAEGALREDTSVAELLPELADPLGAGEPIRVRHLLTHSSGIWDYEELVAPERTEPVSDADVLVLLGGHSERYFAPGAEFRYSNTGYALLALLVERLGGCSFGEFLRERIFRPLGMEHAVAYVAGGRLVVERAYGYSADAVDGFALSDQNLTSAVLGDGGIYASVRELARWEDALVNARLLAPATMAAAWSAARLVDGTSIPYGSGWYVDEDRGRARLTHHGETIGFTNAVIRYPREEVSVWVLTNRTASAPWELAQAVADEVLARVGARGVGEAARWPFHISG